MNQKKAAAYRTLRCDSRSHVGEPRNLTV